jgi:very-short-patch-repair endonuclease
MENEQEPKKSNRKPREPRKPRVRTPFGDCLAKLKRTYDKETGKYISDRRKENLEASLTNPNENAAFPILRKHSGSKPYRQSMWGYRIFDFWWFYKGAAVELDGPEHNAAWDEERDRYNFARSAILVYRVQNGDMERLEAVAKEIKDLAPWKDRRPVVGLYRDAQKAKEAWEAVRCRLDPRRIGTEQPPALTQKEIQRRYLTLNR